MTNMKDVNAEKSLVECNPRDDKNSVNIDPVPKQCADDNWPSQKRVPTQPPKDWTKRKTFNKLGLGQHGLCDPIQTGQIINDLDTPNREVIYRYSRAIRGCDEAMLDLFRNMIVLDEQGQQHTVPIIWASQEKAVAYLLQDNTRKDNSLVVDRIRLPIIAIWNNGINFDQTRFTYQKAYSILPWLTCHREEEGGPRKEPCCNGDEPQFEPFPPTPGDPCPEPPCCEEKCEPPPGLENKHESVGFYKQEKYIKDTFFGVTRGIPVNITYTLYMWSLYEEDMNQMLEQSFLKFSPVAYLQVKGVWWEVIVTLDSTQNNIDLEPGDAKIRVIKYQFNMTAKSYIPQPIYRLKELPRNICCDRIPHPKHEHEFEEPNFMRMNEEEMKNSIEDLKKSIAEIEASMKK